MIQTLVYYLLDFYGLMGYLETPVPLDITNTDVNDIVLDATEEQVHQDRDC